MNKWMNKSFVLLGISYYSKREREREKEYLLLYSEQVLRHHERFLGPTPPPPLLSKMIPAA